MKCFLLGLPASPCHQAYLACMGMCCCCPNKHAASVAVAARWPCRRQHYCFAVPQGERRNLVCAACHARALPALFSPFSVFTVRLRMRLNASSGSPYSKYGQVSATPWYTWRAIPLHLPLCCMTPLHVPLCGVTRLALIIHAIATLPGLATRYT